MALKFVLSIVVLMNLKICVSGIHPSHCMLSYVNQYPEVAALFAEENATEKDLKVAIDIIKKAVKDTDSKKTKHILGRTDIITTDLTQCYGIRKVKSF